MENVFIDTDVIVDFFTGKKPFSPEAVRIFSLIEQKKIKGYVSSLSFSNLYYVLRKLGTHYDHIKNNFRYSILDIYKPTTDDQIIIDRERWRKEVLQTRQSGYNEN
ncbi:MAG: PIN domain-containing protein [Bacteroidales bacterium]